MALFKILLYAASLVAAATAQYCGPIRYMPLGDSITEIVCWRGYLWQTLQETGYANVNFVGSSTIQNPLGCNVPSYKRDSEGHSGYLATGIASLNLLPGWLQQNPADIITIHLGTNDIGHGVGTPQILDAFTVLVRQLRDANPNMKIIVSTKLLICSLLSAPNQSLKVAQIIPMFIGPAETQVLEFNAAIPLWARSLSTAQSPVWVVDQHTGFTAADFRDGIHPNESGDKKMAAKWYPALIKAIHSVQFAPERNRMETPLGL
jgi:lysophospholipase L1-like esterase